MTDSTEAWAVRCAGLVKRYGDLVAVDRLDLDVRSGECFGLLGPNGAGKTTTMEILEGVLAPDAGDVEVLGMTWGGDDHALRERLGIQLQETQLSEKLTVEETLRLFRSFYRRGRSVDDALRALELDGKRSARVGKLSGGQKQRLSVACALVGQPDLLFLDEPSSGLDPQSRRQLWSLVDRFRADGGTVLLTTHYMEEAHVLCDRVGVIDHGRMIALGSPRELIASLGAEHFIDFEVRRGAALPDAALRALPGVRDVRVDGTAGSLTVSDVQRAVPALLTWLADSERELSQLTTHGATLEDVFVSLTGRHLRDA